jgi:hypothetical protein
MTNATNAARRIAAIAAVDAAEAYDVARTNVRAANAVRNATRRRYGMTPTEYNCYNANETGARYADVRAADAADADAIAACDAARDAYADAVAAARHADAVAVAVNVADSLNAITRAAYAVARWYARHA